MPPRAYTRVAVAQIACQPAITLSGRAPFEDPLFDMARPDVLRPEGHAPEELEARFRQLRERIARAHHEQLMLKVRTILARCQEWGVRLIVFPEYSLPWQVLGEVALAGGDMAIVAGTHSVTRPGVKSGLYERLGVAAPAPGEAVCPILHRGRLLHLQPKLSRATPETEMRLGKTWRPVELPEGIPGPMGVLICPYAGLLNAGIIKQLLMKKGFCLALCGHVHSGWFVEERWQEGASRTLRIAAAPSLGSSEIAENNGFNLVEILRELTDQSSATYKIQIRRFFYRSALTWQEHADKMGPFSPDE